MMSVSIIVLAGFPDSARGAAEFGTPAKGRAERKRKWFMNFDPWEHT